MSDDYEKLPYIGKKRAKRLKDKGIEIEDIAQMEESELKKHLPRISNGKIKVIIATARKIAGQMNDIATALDLDKEKAKTLAYNNYDLEKIAKSKKEELAKLLNISEEEAFNLIFKAALKTGVKKPKIKIKKEELNHTGVISKEGFVNGFGALPKPLKKEQGFRIMPLIIISLLIVSGLVGVIYFTTPGLKIDGNFGEWSNVPGYSIGNVSYKYTYKSGSLYFYIHQSNMFSKEAQYYVYIANHSAPGYYINGLYAHYMVEFYGWNGTLKGATLWKYVSGHMLWNFTHASGMIYASGTDGVEFLVNEINPDSQIVFISSSGSTLRSPALHVNSYTAQVVVSNTAEIANSNRPVMKISVNAPVNFELDKVDISYTGCNITSARLLMGNSTLNGYVYNGTVEFNLQSKMKRGTMYFEANYSGESGAVVSFNVSLYSKNMKFTYVYEMSKLYLFSAPSKIKIDGAFADWKDRIGDSIMDVNDANIDLVNYSYSPDFSKVYMEVRGEFMSGTDVPIVRAWAPKDSDRDGVPDKYDPYPHDFNNDGIPDDETNHDVDGDGYIDYPYGNDTWLNTTIPSDFPAPYAGKKVSVYIGPPPPVKPKNGNDTAEIYFGTGTGGSHLYWVPFPVNYKITISGRDGIYTAHAYKYSSGNWVSMGNIESIASGYHAVELATGLNLQNAKMWIMVFNWNHNYDYPTYSERVGRSITTKNVFYFHADSNGNPANMDWNIGSNDATVTLQTPNNGGKDFAEWKYQNEITRKYFVKEIYASFYIDSFSSSFSSAKDYLNISLYGRSSTEYSLIAYGNISKSDLSNNAGNKYEMQLTVINFTIYPLTYVVANFTFWTDFWGGGDSITIKYNNTAPYDSNITIATNSTIQIENIWTANDTTRNAQAHFHKGEIVGVYANVTDPLGVAHIADATYISIVDQLGNTILSGSKMTWDSDGFGWVHFYFSFQLVGSPYVYTGKYPISVVASDVEGFSVQDDNGSFWVNSAIHHINSKYLLVPTGPYHAWFRHILRNTGDGDDIINFRVDARNLPHFDVCIYVDVNWNSIIDSSDELYAEYNASQGKWTYIRNDTDGNNEPDITILYGSRRRVILQENVSLSSTHSTETLTMVYSSFTGNSTRVTNDVAQVRDVKIKTLYLRGGNPVMTLYPREGNVDNKYSGADYNGKGIWLQNISFANDFTLTGNIVVHIYVDKKGANTGNVTIYMDDGTIVGTQVFTLNAANYYNMVVISPRISLIPAGHRISLVFFGDKKCDVYYNSSNYPSRIEFNTTSYIHVDWVKLYNSTTMQGQQNYTAGNSMIIRAQVRDPFGGFEIKSVYTNVTGPNNYLGNLNMNLRWDNGSYQVYETTYTIPSFAYVGTYTVNVTAVEGNGVRDYMLTSFNLLCNISISPHSNSSTGTVVWYNHTIWNNGSGTDVVNIIINSDAQANVTLYIYDNGWKLAAYSNTGTGWNWVNASYDSDNDDNPDYILNRSSSVKIMLKVSTTQNVNVTVGIEDISTCSDSAVDYTTVPELNPSLLIALPIVILIFIERRRRKK